MDALSAPGPKGERQDGASNGERLRKPPFMVRYLTTNGYTYFNLRHSL